MKQSDKQLIHEHEMEDDTPIYVDNETLLKLAGVQYRKLMYGEWLQPDPRETYLLEIAKEYFVACDVYDKYHCSGVRNGEPVPITPNEFRAINQNSIEVRRKIIAGRGISEKEFHEAIKLYHRMKR